ncbi:DNA repair protein RadA [bacterium]|nr:DNA repair protein RadA [bacterium]
MPKVKLKTVYACQNCGHQTSKWLGKCPDCNQWNSFVEEIKTGNNEPDIPFFELKSDEAIPLSEVTLDSYQRIPTQLKELDRVLGGGIVPGSLILLGGDPGIGKSTLVLQALNKLAESGVSVLYATGEESREQIKMRANRLNISSSLYVVAENSIERILNQVQKIKPDVLVVDSIQTVYLQNLESAPGSISQVRECAGKLLYLSKTQNIATLLIGHVTKEGALAGPRVLEHMVDTVLYFEGDTRQQCRILRSIKNRFGSTNEIGVFEMTGDGLIEVTNPSLFFLPERSKEVSGSTITAALEGARPFLVEIQALVSDSSLTNPRRTTLGVDNGRVALVIAVLEKILGLNLYNQDVYVNAAGGFKIMEPAADAAILAALVSSFRNKPLPHQTLILGEVGLTGEIRGVMGADIRLSEAHKLGFTHCILPKNNKKIIGSSQIKVSLVESVSDLIDALI